MTIQDRLSRRRFLAAASALAAPYLIPACALGRNGAVPPSRRIGVGVVGVGGQGSFHAETFLALPQTQLVAVCDVFDSKRQAMKKRADDHYAQTKGIADYRGCAAYNDFRELIARDDIDAVAIAAPEFWHALISIAAMRCGKDVYCEKALSLTIAEGRALCQAVRRYARVFQIGTQQRSDRRFRFACELARNGYLGELHTVKVGVPGGRALPNAAPRPVPPGLDYDLWLGPAPYKPYTDLQCSFNWYFIYDYCAGWIQSWGVHHCDIALWGAPALATLPLEVQGAAVFPADGLADTSITWRVEFTCADGVRLLFSDDSAHGHGVRFEGDRGWVKVDRGSIIAEPKSLLTATIKPDEERLYQSDHHHVNFLDCIRSRRDPVGSVEAGHAATTITLVADIATRLGRKLTWDWKSERFLNDDDANRFLSRPMRSPWSL